MNENDVGRLTVADSEQRPSTTDTDKGIGASLIRKEDARFLAGEGEYVGDIKFPGMLDVAFVRSPIAHGRISGIEIPDDANGTVFTMDDMAGVQPIRAVATLPGFKPSDQWPMAREKVRQVGEPIAMCIADTRAQAEDIAAEVFVDIDELPAVVDMLDARSDSPRALVHEAWGDNVFYQANVNEGTESLDSIATRAPIVVRRHLRTARQSMAPMEGRGVVCQWSTRLDQLTVYTSTQMPHINRAGLSECLGLDHGQVRVVSPDVGGGFGYKGILLPEEICLGWLARHLKRPVRWIEDRREQLIANTNCREHDYDITMYADKTGQILAIDCEASVDSGAYSSYPFSACLEAAQVGSILPGPYKMEGFRCKTWSVATNKPPILPYRGVARTGVCFALEVTLDAVAREAGLEPYAVRLANLVQADDMPYDNITGKHFDSGDYPQALKRAVDALDLASWRKRQAAGEPDGRLIGVGHAIYCEQAAHGTSVYSGWGIPMVPGFEPCNARLTPDGVLELRIGAHSHGQGMETTLAQVAHTKLGIDPADVRLIHGDTALSAYSTGTWGSRCAVMSGGAVGQACDALSERIRHIAAALMAVSADEILLTPDGVLGPTGTTPLSLKEIGFAWYREPQRLPPEIDPGGLEVAIGYKAQRDTGTFSYAAHAVALAVDPDLGSVELLDYVITEDGGTLLNRW